jgi:hypothetical protein
MQQLMTSTYRLSGQRCPILPLQHHTSLGYGCANHKTFNATQITLPTLRTVSHALVPIVLKHADSTATAASSRDRQAMPHRCKRCSNNTCTQLSAPRARLVTQTNQHVLSIKLNIPLVVMLLCHQMQGFGICRHCRSYTRPQHKQAISIALRRGSLQTHQTARHHSHLTSTQC